jgi:hypothetical protein
MKPHFLLFIVLQAALSLGVNTCIAANQSGSPTMTNHNANTTTSLTSTFCIGRFLIDVPSGSRLSGGNYKYDFIGIEPVKLMTSDAFNQDVDGKETKLKATKHRVEPSLLRTSLRPQQDTEILAFWEEDFITSVVNLEGYRWIDGSRFKFKDEVSNNKQEFGLNRMRDALSRLRPRADTDIPSEPGYCFAGGFIANPRWRNEEAGVDIDIAGHPDAFVSIWIYPLASYKRDRPLLERMGGLTQALGNLATSVHVLRKGDRQIGPYKGQEHLASAPNSGGMRGHAFVWETQGDGTLDTPAIKIELTTGHQDNQGNPQKTTLTDRQAIQLWDDILNSFRLRPTGEPVKTSGLNPEPRPVLPLGEFAATGRACPQTGWWQASEQGEIAGGRRKRFVAGEPMPDVVLLGEASVWQKLKGERPTHRTATLWKLVSYDDAGANPPLAPAGQNVNAAQAPDGGAGSHREG